MGTPVRPKTLVSEEDVATPSDLAMVIVEMFIYAHVLEKRLLTICRR